MNLSKKQKLFVIIIIAQIVLIIIFAVFIKFRRDQVTKQQAQDTRSLPSIFASLPYEGESFSVYYYAESQKFTIVLREGPYSLAEENAMFFLHQYDETRNFTKEDVEIVGPSIMNIEE